MSKLQSTTSTVPPWRLPGRSRSRRRLVGGAGVVILAGALAACGGAGGDSSVTLDFQTGLAVDSAEFTTLEEITTAFQEENSDISVNLVPSGQNYENDIRVRLASGDAPDLWNTHGWSVDRYGEFLTPLEDEDWADSLDSSLENTMVDDDGHVYALPTNVDINGILVNLDVLADAGYTSEEITTWDDFEAAATAMADAGISPIYAGGKALSGAIANRILSGAFTEDQLTSMADGTFVVPGFEEALELVNGWVDAGYFNPDYSSATRSDMSSALAQGQAGFGFGPSYILQDALLLNPDANVGFIPVPSLVDSGYLAGGERTAFGISNESAYTDEAKQYLNYLSGLDNISELAAASGSLPGLTGAEADLGVLQSSFDLYVTDGAVPVVPHFDRVYLPNGAWSTLGTVTDSVITGQASPADATAEMQSAYDRLHSEAQ